MKTIKMHILSFTEGSNGVNGDIGLSSEQEWDRISSPNNPKARSTSSIKGILSSKGKTRGQLAKDRRKKVAD